MGCVSQKSQKSSIYSSTALSEKFDIEKVKSIIIHDKISEFLELVSQGLDINHTIAENMNRSLIHIAADSGSSRILRFLALKGADLNKKDSYGLTPVGLARLRNDNKTRILLYQLGAEKEFCFGTSKTTEPSPTTPGVPRKRFRRAKTLSILENSQI